MSWEITPEDIRNVRVNPKTDMEAVVIILEDITVDPHHLLSNSTWLKEQHCSTWSITLHDAAMEYGSPPALREEHSE